MQSKMPMIECIVTFRCDCFFGRLLELAAMGCRRQSIVLFIFNFSRGAGSERAAATLANYLAGAGYDVAVLSICGDNTSFYDIDDRVELHTLFSHEIIDNRRDMARVLKALRQFYSLRTIDLVIDVFAGLSLYTNAVKRHFSFKNITWEHFSLGNETPVSRLARFCAVHFSDQLVVLTKADLSGYCRRYARSAVRVKAIYNASPYNCEIPLPFSDRKKVVLAIGRLTRVKRFDRILKVWSALEGNHSDWTLRIAGDGELRDALRAECAELGLRHVSFLGQVLKLEDEYREASIIVSTSESEALPMNLIEALSFGVPAVTLDYQTGPREILQQGVSGFIAEGETVDDQMNAMTERLDKLMSDNTLLSSMMASAAQGAKAFSLDEIGGQWLSLIHELLNDDTAN
ncbi:glycosyltransferase [Olsenella sp. KH1P3]|uniref:glycosyltransferase n=2 Tax=Atopobiaceae TaxID=1643824 RepID=UPI00099AC57C|nr:glycosyltransferase [Olsenella sp. KH1P3]